MFWTFLLSIVYSTNSMGTKIQKFNEYVHFAQTPSWSNGMYPKKQNVSVETSFKQDIETVRQQLQEELGPHVEVNIKKDNDGDYFEVLVIDIKEDIPSTYSNFKIIKSVKED